MCANDYTFGYGDPVNHPDLNGQFSLGCWLNRGLAVAGIGLGVAGLVVTSPEWGAALAVAGLGASAIAAIRAARSHDDWAKGAAIIGGVLSGLGVAAAGAGLLVKGTEFAAPADVYGKAFGSAGLVGAIVDLVHNPKHKC